MAIFSNVHSNLPALEAVLKDIREKRASRLVCLGNTVGYNADPAACLERVRAVCEFVIQGNHDMACAGGMDVDWFNGVAKAGIDYSRKQLSEEQRAYLRELPLVKSIDGQGFVHASFDEPAEFRYVLSGPAALSNFRIQDSGIGFSGHTHKPLVWHLDEKRRLALCEAAKKSASGIPANTSSTSAPSARTAKAVPKPVTSSSTA